MTLDSGALSAMTGISDRTIRDWLAKNLIPRTTDPNRAITAICAHLQKQIREARQERREGEDEGRVAKIRLTLAQAEKVELENEERAGELVEAAQVAQAWGKYLDAARGVLDNIPARLAPVLAGESDAQKCQVILQTAVDEVRENLGSSEFVMSLGASGGDGFDS